MILTAVNNGKDVGQWEDIIFKITFPHCNIVSLGLLYSKEKRASLK